jgi:hypothetical protein
MLATIGIKGVLQVLSIPLGLYGSWQMGMVFEDPLLRSPGSSSRRRKRCLLQRHVPRFPRNYVPSVSWSRLTISVYWFFT